MSTLLPARPRHRGLLIVIEGLDRSGKTTQCQRLLSTLQTKAAIATAAAVTTDDTTTPTLSAAAAANQVRYQKFPDRTTPTGQMINSYLTNQTTTSDHAIHLLFSANRWEARDSLLASLAAGTTVIVDRYSFSGAVYSAAKRNPDLDLQWAWDCEVGLPRPDLVVFLDVAEEVARARGGFGAERYEREEMQRVVRGLFRLVFEKVVEEESDGGGGGGGGLVVEVVDAGATEDEVASKVAALVEAAWERVRVVGADGGGVMMKEVGKLGRLRF